MGRSFQAMPQQVSHLLARQNDIAKFSGWRLRNFRMNIPSI
jgi:hypothetical protein